MKHSSEASLSAEASRLKGLAESHHSILIETLISIQLVIGRVPSVIRMLYFADHASLSCHPIDDLFLIHRARNAEIDCILPSIF